MTERVLELSLLLPRAAECGGCVDEVGRELLRLDGIHAVEPDVSRGLLGVSFDEDALSGEAVETFARRAGAQAHCEDHCPLAAHAHGPLDLSRPLPGEDGGERRVLHVTGMDCADCAVKLQGALRKERGVRSADVNFGAATLAVAIDPSQTALPDVFRAVRRLGYDTVERRAQDEASSGGGAAAAARASRGFWLSEPRAVATLVSGVLTVAGFVASAVAPAAAPWLFGAAVVSGGVFVARAALFSLRARQVDMNVLMTLAMIGAAAIGQWSEAALVAFLFSLGTVLQAATLERTRRAISGLMKLAPPTATVLRPCEDDGELEEKTIDVGEIVVGDIVIVRPGERAAIDGVVVEGAAAADQAPVTGESAPGRQGTGRPGLRRLHHRGRHPPRARHRRGLRHDHRQDRPHGRGGAGPARAGRDHRRPLRQQVHAGRRGAGGGGRLHPAAPRRVVRHVVLPRPRAAHHQLPVRARHLHPGEHPRGARPRDEERRAHQGRRLPGADGRAQGGRLRQDGDAHAGPAAGDRRRAAERRLRRPRAQRRGGARALQRAPAGAGDHGTGGRERRPARHGRSGRRPRRSSGRRSGRGLLLLHARLLLGGGREPGRAARAMATTTRATTTTTPRTDPDVERFRAIPGRGVRAELDGRLHFVGRPDLLGAHAADPALVQAVERLERQGKTAVVVGDEDGALGVIAVSDPLRAGARETVDQLRALGVADVAMLTGDNPETAAAVAAEAGVTDVRAGLLPEQKVAAVAELRDRAGAVAMVGDGVNDAPALAAATLGIAMGAAGTDAALETADIALMGDDLSAVPDTIRLARRTTRVIWQNIVFSIAVKAVFLVLAPLGLVSLWLAVFADMGTSLLVTGNGLRLYRRWALPVDSPRDYRHYRTLELTALATPLH